METAEATLERELDLVSRAQKDYKSRLDSVTPKLLERALSLMMEKKVAVQLTGYFDAEGNYLDQTQKRNGSAVFYLFPEGIKRIETSYDKEGLPKTGETSVSRADFLKWVKMHFNRIEDVYRRLLEYQNRRPLENFPTDDIV